METRKLETMPFDRMEDCGLCHATGYEVNFHDGSGWWNEYVSPDGTRYYYGR